MFEKFTFTSSEPSTKQGFRGQPAPPRPFQKLKAFESFYESRSYILATCCSLLTLTEVCFHISRKNSKCSAFTCIYQKVCSKVLLPGNSTLPFLSENKLFTISTDLKQPFSPVKVNQSLNNVRMKGKGRTKQKRQWQLLQADS